MFADYLKQEVLEPQRPPEYQRRYTEFLSEVLIFAYQQPRHKISKVVGESSINYNPLIQ